MIFTYTFVAVYRVLISTGYGPTTDKVSIILVGKGGAQTGIHDLPGVFGSKTQVLVESVTTRELKQTTTSTATRTSKNKSFYEQDNGSSIK